MSLAHLPPLSLSPYDGNPSSDPPPGRTRLSSKRNRSSDSPDANNKVRKARTEEGHTLTSNHPDTRPLEIMDKNALEVDDVGSQQQSSSPCPSFHSAKSETEALDLN